MRFWTKHVDQLGFVVRDMDAAISYWNERMGVGPFIVNTREMAGLTYRGEPTQVEAKFTSACAGEIYIELIQQLNDGKSVYRDFLDSGQEGLQHLGYFTYDYDNDYRACLESGLVVVQEGPSRHDAATRFAYFEAPDEKGPQIELIGMSLTKRARFGALRQRSEQWIAENFA